MSSIAQMLMSQATSIQEITKGNTSGGTSKMSLGVVYSGNCKRIVISKKLAEVLKLTDVAQLSFVVDKNSVLLAKVTSNDPTKRMELGLKDEKDTVKDAVTGKKISYNADAAYGIVTAFGLDYKGRSSRSFDKIEIDNTDPNNPVAVITITGA